MGFQRTDGRLPNELRDIIIVFDGLDGVDGSARFGFGDTRALASVSGPIEVRLAAEQANKATFEVLVRPLAGVPGTDAKTLATFLRSALTPSIALTHHPRTLIQLVAQSLTALPPTALRARGATSATSSILRAHPALVAALINASTLALVNAASFPMKGMVCAVAVGRLPASARTRLQRLERAHGQGQQEEGEEQEQEQEQELNLIVDPSESELAHLDGAGSFAFLISGSRASTHTSKEEDDETSTMLRNSGSAEESSSNNMPTAQLVWSSWAASPSQVSNGAEDHLVLATELARAGALRVWEHMRSAVVRQYQGLGHWHHGPSPSVELDAGNEKEGESKSVKAKGVTDDHDAKMEI